MGVQGNAAIDANPNYAESLEVLLHLAAKHKTDEGVSWLFLPPRTGKGVAIISFRREGTSPKGTGAKCLNELLQLADANQIRLEVELIHPSLVGYFAKFGFSKAGSHNVRVGKTNKLGLVWFMEREPRKEIMRVDPKTVGADITKFCLDAPLHVSLLVDAIMGAGFPYGKEGDKYVQRKLGGQVIIEHTSVDLLDDPNKETEIKGFWLREALAELTVPELESIYLDVKNWMIEQRRS